MEENCWKWDGNNLYLTFESAGCVKLSLSKKSEDLYWVDKGRLTTHHDLSSWLLQLMEKTWCTDKILADFVRAVEEHIGLMSLKD